MVTPLDTPTRVPHPGLSLTPTSPDGSTIDALRCYSLEVSGAGTEEVNGTYYFARQSSDLEQPSGVFEMHGLYGGRQVTYTIYLWPVVIGHGIDKRDVPHWFLTVLNDPIAPHSELHGDGEDADFYCAQPQQGEILLLPMDNLQWITEKDGGFGLDPPPKVKVNLIDSTAFDSPARSHIRSELSIGSPGVGDEADLGGSIGSIGAPAGIDGATYNPESAHTMSQSPMDNCYSGYDRAGLRSDSGDKAAGRSRSSSNSSLQGAVGDEDSIDYSDYEIVTPDLGD